MVVSTVKKKDRDTVRTDEELSGIQRNVDRVSNVIRDTFNEVLKMDEQGIANFENSPREFVKDMKEVRHTMKGVKKRKENGDAKYSWRRV